MAKAFIFLDLELKSGVTEKEFEEFIKEDLSSYTPMPGHKSYAIKGISGDRDRQYTYIVEIESLEIKNKNSTPDDQPTEYYKKFQEDHPKNKIFIDKFFSMVSVIDGHTDYVELD